MINYKTFAVGDYVFVRETDEYANGKITHIHSDGVIVVRPLKEAEQTQHLLYGVDNGEEKKQNKEN